MQERLKGLATLNINCDMARKLGFSARPIIHDFANKMSRKVFIDSRLINSLATFSIFFQDPKTFYGMGSAVLCHPCCP